MQRLRSAVGHILQVRVLQRFSLKLKVALWKRNARRNVLSRNWVAVFDYNARAALAGDIESQASVGLAYLNGVGTVRSISEGAKWLRLAAGSGHIAAQVALAQIYFDGSDVKSVSGFPFHDRQEPNRSEALRWAEQAAASGSSDGQALLAALLVSSPSEAQDRTRAALLYRFAADAGNAAACLGLATLLLTDGAAESAAEEATALLKYACEAELPQAFFQLAVLYERGLGVDKDEIVATELYRRGAELGVVPSQASYGSALIAGVGVTRNAVIGESWLRRAALSGDAAAAIKLGELYSDGETALPNYIEALKWFTLAAENNAYAARVVASMHRSGKGTSQDIGKSTLWLRRSAMAGDMQATVELANMLLTEEGCEEDKFLICRYFQKQEEAGDPEAALNFAICLEKGIGTKRDLDRALKSMRLAAQRLPRAKLLYGRMLAAGICAAPNPEVGREWVRRAAEDGMIDAKVELAEMLVNGRGGERNSEEAKKLFLIAADNGHVGAMYALGAMFGGGHGISVDRDLSNKWLCRAAECGHKQAQLALKERGLTVVVRGGNGTSDDCEGPVLGGDGLDQNHGTSESDDCAVAYCGVLAA